MRGGHHRIVACGRIAALGLALALGIGGAAFAEGLRLDGANADRATLFRQQVSVLDSRFGKEFGDSASAGRARVAGMATPPVNRHYRAIYLDAARSAALRHGVPADLFVRLVTRESGWNPAAVSPRGAVGLAQLMPATASGPAL